MLLSLSSRVACLKPGQEECFDEYFIVWLFQTETKRLVDAADKKYALDFKICIYRLALFVTKVLDQNDYIITVEMIIFCGILFMKNVPIFKK